MQSFLADLLQVPREVQQVSKSSGKAMARCGCKVQVNAEAIGCGGGGMVDEVW